jgi:hypothetical protein
MRGTCKHCGCTDEAACWVPSTDPFASSHEQEPCHWINTAHTVCSNPDCVRKETKP